MRAIDWTTVGPILAGLAAVLALGLPIAQFMRTGRLARAAEEAAQKAQLTVVKVDGVSGRIDGFLDELKTSLKRTAYLEGQNDERARAAAAALDAEPKT